MSKGRQRGKPYPRCMYCQAEMRRVTVLVGTEQREVLLSIDRWPHPEGCVIKRRDGRLRLLPIGRKPLAGVLAYRIHSARECAPSVIKDSRNTG